MVSHDNVSMALFCDFENVALGVRDANYEKFDIRPVLERLLLKGSIVVKKAYCDWERYKGFKASMHEANFELIEIPHVRQSGKNSADIRLVVDALDLCYTKSHVDTFVIISGDSDFSPLVSKLRENAKHVIGVGVKQSTSDLLIANCDEFIFYDDLVRESQSTAARRETRESQPNTRRAPEDERRRKEEAEARKTKALVIASETFEALMAERGDGGKIWASVLKEAIKRRKPDFNESYYGFRAFGNLLEEAQARGLMEFGRDDKSGAYVYRANLSEGSESANGNFATGANGTGSANAAAGASGNAAATGAASERGAAAGSNRRGGRRDGKRTGQANPSQAATGEVNRSDDALFEDAGGRGARSQEFSHAQSHADTDRQPGWERESGSSRNTAANPFDAEQENLPFAMPAPTAGDRSSSVSDDAAAPPAGESIATPAKSRRGPRNRAAKKATAASTDDAAASASFVEDAAGPTSSAVGMTAGAVPAQAGGPKPRAPRRGRRTDPQAEPQFEAVAQADASAHAAETPPAAGASRAARAADPARATPQADAGEDAASAPGKTAARKPAARGRRPRKTAAGKETT